MATWQEKLDRYQSDKSSAIQEVNRAKQVYKREKANGASQQRLQEINHWANQVRDAAKLNDSKYGEDVTLGTSSANYNAYQANQRAEQLQEQLNARPDPVDLDQFRTEEATISDIASKYGFDYSREYAKTQAEKLAQQKRDAAQEGLKQVDNNTVSATDSLDRSYFQQYMNQAQQQVNNGQNAGIADNQNLRLAMNRQSALGDVYRDANLQKYELNNELNRIPQWKTAYIDELYNKRRQQGFENAMDLTRINQRDNLGQLEAAMQQRGQEIDMSQFNQDMGLKQDKFTWDQYVDERTLEQRDLRNALAVQEFNRPYNELTAYQRQQLEQQQFENELAIKEFNRPYNELTAYQKAQIGMQQQRINASYASDSPSGSEVDILDMARLQDMYKNADEKMKTYLETQYPQFFGGESGGVSEYEQQLLLKDATSAGFEPGSYSNNIKEITLNLAQKNGWGEEEYNKAKNFLEQHNQRILIESARESGNNRGDLMEILQGERDRKKRIDEIWNQWSMDGKTNSPIFLP